MLPPFIEIPEEKIYYSDIENLIINPLQISTIVNGFEEGKNRTVLTMASAEMVVLNFETTSEFLAWMKAYKYE